MIDILEALLWLLAVFAALYLLLWVVPATWERIRAAQFARETERIEGTAPARRSVGELLTEVGHWLAVKATRSDRTGAGR